MSVWSGLRAKLLVGAITAALAAGAGVTSASAAPVHQSAASRSIAPAAPVPPAADATLKSLKITTPKKVAIKPKFKAKVLKYTAIVPFGTKKVVFKAVPTQAKANVVIMAPKKYKLGSNKVTITVTAINKKAKKVYIVIIKIFSKDATLTALTAATPSAPLTLNEAFNPKVLSYTATAPVGTKTISFNALPRAKGSKLVVDAPAVFAEGPNTVKITVTAPDNKTKTVYTIVVNVTPAWTIDPSLASLAVTSPARVSLSPNFTPDTTAYDVRVPVGTTNVSFSATAAQAAKGATVDVKAPATYVLGTNTVTMTVTAPDKKTVRVYTLTVTVPAARANDPSLASLSIDSPASVGFTPAFDPTVLAYTATAPVGTTSVRFVPVTTQPSSALTASAPASYDDPVKRTAVILPVNPGDNTLTLTITAPDGITTRTYTVLVKVLRAATVQVDAASLTKIVGGFKVNVKVQNATLSATANLGSEAACSTSNPSVSVGEPNGASVASVAVTGVFKGCTITLSFSATPSAGYAVGTIAPISAVSDSDIVQFTPGTPVATADGFTVTWTVTNGSIDNCQMSADSPSIASLDTFDDTGATVSGLLTSMSATVECTFTPAPLMFNTDARSVTGTSLRPSKMTVGTPASTADGFIISVSATGCVIATTVTSGKSSVTNPAKGLYTVKVTGLKPAATATVSVTCVGATGFAGIDTPVTRNGAAAASTELPVTVVPRIADASDLDPNSPPASEADLPGLTPGLQPQLLYVTSPVWDTTSAVTTTYTWQVSAADRDSDGVECSDPNYGIGTDAGTDLWTDFDDRAKAALDKSVPQLLRIGILATKRPDYVGKCLRVRVRGTSGSRATTLMAASVPLSSTEPPAICSSKPSFIGASGLDADTNVLFAERGNVLVATNGVCTGSLGLAVSYQWQYTTATEAGSAGAVWQNLNNTTSRLVVGGTNLGTSIRVVVRYKADNGTFDVASAPLPVTGTVDVPTNSVAPQVTGGGVGSAAARITLDLGTWESAGGAKLIITWEYLSPEADSDWTAVDNQASVTAKGYSAKKAGKYRVRVTFSSYSEAHEAVTVTTNEVSWSLV